MTGYRVQVDASKCAGCAQCYAACPNKVFVIVNKKSVPVNQDACVGCRACVVKCPANTITIMPRDVYATYARFYSS
jgi:NAD-dependent dihydropyrimidine dehydrogenase PreA subunit